MQAAVGASEPHQRVRTTKLDNFSCDYPNYKLGLVESGNLEVLSFKLPMHVAWWIYKNKVSTKIKNACILHYSQNNSSAMSDEEDVRSEVSEVDSVRYRSISSPDISDYDPLGDGDCDDLSNKTTKRKKKAVWQEFKSVTRNGKKQNICRYCNEHVSPKAGRMETHLTKCTLNPKNNGRKERNIENVFAMVCIYFLNFN